MSNRQIEQGQVQTSAVQNIVPGDALTGLKLPKTREKTLMPTPTPQQRQAAGKKTLEQLQKEEAIKKAAMECRSCKNIKLKCKCAPAGGGGSGAEDSSANESAAGSALAANGLGPANTVGPQPTPAGTLVQDIKLAHDLVQPSQLVPRPLPSIKDFEHFLFFVPSNTPAAEKALLAKQGMVFELTPADQTHINNLEHLKGRGFRGLLEMYMERLGVLAGYGYNMEEMADGTHKITMADKTKMAGFHAYLTTVLKRELQRFEPEKNLGQKQSTAPSPFKNPFKTPELTRDR